MAQIIISTFDAIHGSLSSVIKVEDKDLDRIYKAYKREQVINYIKSKKENNQALEDWETVDNLIKEVSPQQILDEFAEKFITDIINRVHHMEFEVFKDKYLEDFSRIEWE